MINPKEIIELLSRAGLLPSILVVGGWVYSILLLLLLLYNLVFVRSTKKNNKIN